jgi:hypothetical protein
MQSRKEGLQIEVAPLFLCMLNNAEKMSKRDTTKVGGINFIERNQMKQ